MSELVPASCIEEARVLVQARLFDDISDASAEEDLRDYGLDSIRLIAVLGTLRERGVSIDFAEMTAAPSLLLLGTALAHSRRSADGGEP